MSIHTFLTKIKGWRDFWPLSAQYRKKLVFIGIIALSHVTSFYLGYVAYAESIPDSSPVVIQCTQEDFLQPEAITEAQIPSTPSADTLTKGSTKNSSGSGSFVASKNGTRYYPVQCAGAKRIKEENKVWFKTKAAAEATGLTLAQGC